LVLCVTQTDFCCAPFSFHLMMMMGWEVDISGPFSLRQMGHHKKNVHYPSTSTQVLF
jgi:hypothetical protein